MMHFPFEPTISPSSRSSCYRFVGILHQCFELRRQHVLRERRARYTTSSRENSFRNVQSQRSQEAMRFMTPEVSCIGYASTAYPSVVDLRLS